jgi:hypothetical protein
LEEKKDPYEVIDQLVEEDVQLESFELIGRELTDCEMREVKHKLSDFIQWDFYVGEAIKDVVKSDI